jgi:uncharacterized protein
MTSGYSGTPLARKLSLKDGMRVRFEAMPPAVRAEIEGAGLALVVAEEEIDAAHIFVTGEAELRDSLERMLTKLARNGQIWVSWPKKAAGVAGRHREQGAGSGAADGTGRCQSVRDRRHMVGIEARRAQSPAVSTSERILTLDVLRGIAVMGIFSVNVISFAMPEAAYLNPAAYGGASGVNLATWAANFVLIDNKMRCLFSVLFGASLLLVVERAQSPASVHYRRMGWLLLFGLAHYYLVWDGDILTLYAPIGMLAFAFRKMPVEGLLGAACGLLLLGLAMMAAIWNGFAVGEVAAHASPAALAEWRSDASMILPPTPAELAHDFAIYRGGWAAIVAHRLQSDAFGPLLNLVAFGPQTLALMLLGMAGLKSGFLTGAWEAARYRRLLLLGLAVGLPAHAAIAWWSWRSGFPPTGVFAAYSLVSVPFYLVQAAGYAAGFVLLARRGGALAGRLAATGRAAFTNYLGTSLVAAFLFFGPIGLYGRLDRFHAWLVAPCLWLVMLAWSKPWLDRFRYGPFEWAWRSLSRGRLQPMRR